MTVTNSLVSQVDLPVWEWLRFCPITTAAIGSTCISEEESKSRYLYYLGATFWRYDTKMDSWQQLATPNITPVTTSSMKYTSFGGYRGNILGVTNSTTLQIPSLQGNIFKGKTIRITSGAGVGQTSIISNSTDTIHDSGLITAVSGVLSITDNLKRWEINQYIGYSVRLVYGTGQSQIRKVIYNDTNTLYFYDANYHQLEPWNNIGFSTITPFAAPVITAGLQAVYYIESAQITLSAPLSILPNESSSFTIEGGGIFAFSSVAVSPFSSFQYYDILADTWITKTPLGGQIPAAYGTDFAMERTGQHGGIKLSAATATSATTRTITKGSAGYTVDEYRNSQVRITSGTGMGQRFRIVSNTTDTLEIPRDWDTTPNNTSKFEIWPNTDEIYLAGNACATMFKYSVENDYWYTGNDIDYGQVMNMSVHFDGQEPYGVLTAVRNTGGITGLTQTPVSGGSGYLVGDLCTIATTGTVGKCRVESISGNGVATSVSLYSAGLNYNPGTKLTTPIAPSTGSNLSVNVIGVSTVGRITTNTGVNVNLYKGDTVAFSGATEPAWNKQYEILAIDSLTTFDVVTTAAANASAVTSNSTVLIVDSNKNWAVNEHVGKLVSLSIAGTSPTHQIRRITANSATTLTVATITQGVLGTSRYVIHQPDIIGKASQFVVNDKKSNGYALSGTSTSLTVGDKNWYNNQWSNYNFRIHAGTGIGKEVLITANTSNTLYYSTQTFTPDYTTRYSVMDSFSTISAVTNTTNATISAVAVNWALNQWAGRRVRITSGLGAGQEATITSNSSSVLTITGVFTTAPDSTSTFCILEAPARGLATTLQWIFNSSNVNDKGKYLWSARGGSSNLFDRFNINTNTWELGINSQPKTEIFTTGTMYAYDGADGIIIHRGDAAATLRTFRLDTNTMEVETLGMPPYAHGTPLIGSRMEVLGTADGLKYLYVMRHSGQEMWRTLLF